MDKDNLVKDPRPSFQTELEQQLWIAEYEIKNLISLINALPPKQAEHLIAAFARIAKGKPKHE